MGTNNDQQKEVFGIPLDPPLGHLIYFNGRFMTAADMESEQKAFLDRHRLAHRGLGPGVSYGLYVSADEKKEYLTVSAGHASDGLGQDLWRLREEPPKIKFSDLMSKYEARPLSTDHVGPAITTFEVPAATANLEGLFILTATRYQKAGQAVEELGSQCNDASKPCRPGSNLEGITLQLVFVESFPSFTPGWVDADYLGWGARAYFGKELLRYRTQLSQMAVPLGTKGPTPFAAPLQMADSTHVPLAALYIRGKSLIAVDVWAARRLRTAVESSRWLASLLELPEPMQTARILQFQNHLVQALAAKEPGLPSLWRLGFTNSANGVDRLVLPGCGFLPIDKAQPLAVQLEKYLTDSSGGVVPHEIRKATQGEMNSVFASALASGDLWLKSAASTQWKSPSTPRQLTIWYSDPDRESSVPGAYDGFVMFTWPMNQDLIARIPEEVPLQEYHVCAQTEGTVPRLNDDSGPEAPNGKLDVRILTAEGYDAEWIGVSDKDAPRPATLGRSANKSAVIYSALVEGVTIRHEADKPDLAFKVSVTPGAPGTTAITVTLKTDNMKRVGTSTKEVVEAVNAHAEAKKLIVARYVGEGSGAPEDSKIAVALVGQLPSVLKRFRARLRPHADSVTLKYAVAVKQDDGTWKAGSWTDAADLWCAGAHEEDPTFPNGTREFIRGIAFGLEGIRKDLYVVRYQVAGKVVAPDGKIVEIRTSELVNSDATPNAPTLCAVYASDDVDKKKPLPIHRILVRVLPKCGPWP